MFYTSVISALFLIGSIAGIIYTLVTKKLQDKDEKVKKRFQIGLGLICLIFAISLIFFLFSLRKKKRISDPSDFTPSTPLPMSVKLQKRERWQHAINSSEVGMIDFPE